jgi:uncharacterized protein (DUF1501 family)
MKGLAGLAAVATARASASSTKSARKLVFVFANGGWDPLSVFAPIFGSPYVDGNDGGERATAGGLAYVDHPDRPSVRAFFEQYHASTAIVNGISVPSLSHEVCTRLVWTGQSGEGRPDWPSTLGAAAADDYTLPSLVIAGPSFPDVYGVYSARAGADGQLADLVDGSILNRRDDFTDQPLPDALRGLVDQRVKARADAFAGRSSLAASFRTALERAQALTGAAEPIDLRSAIDFRSSCSVAADALAQGVARVVSVEADGSWDSHTNNDPTQSFQFESLFDGLSGLMVDLRNRGLDQDTAVVVLSEMGRTPLRNASDGRDHWPYTSALLIGGGVRGDQVVSGFDDGYFALGYDPATGEQTPDGAPLGTENLGATLLALADVDPADHLPADVAPIAAVLA